MPKLEYPAYFEGGLLGVKCKEDIEHREVYLYVPYKMMLTVKDTQSHPILGEVIQQHPECFEEEENDDWEQLTLALRLLYEMTLGKKGYWYPYLRLMPDVEFTSAWSEDEMEMAEDFRIRFELHEYREELKKEWEQFELVLRSYPDIFPERYVSQALFYNQYAQVCTRCFGYSVNSTSMIPMADNLNHSSVDVTQELVNISLH